MKKLFLLLVTVLTISLCASAQMRTVKGIVLDADNDEPLIGVSVTAGPGTGAATDVDGKFSIQVPASASTLKISYVGYKTQDVKIGNGDLTIRLHSDSELLNEVIAVAYGTATRASFTGSAAVVGSAEIENAQVSNAVNALKGKVAGVQINNTSGAPGQDNPSVLIRGISSINAGTAPLYVVDGTPFSGSLQNLNPSDIESMTVLKDAASAALYGARGANGVILITTKRAKSGEATVTLDVKLGSNSRASQDYNYIKNPAQYYETYFKALYNYRISRGDSHSNANAWANRNLTASNDYGLGYNVYTVPNGQSLIGLNGKLNPNATLGRLATYQGVEYWITPDNWMDAAYHNSLRQEYNLSVAKGGDQTNFYLSASYLDNQGITPQSGFQRFTGRLSADTQAKPWLKISGDMSYTHYEMDAYGSDEGSTNSTGNPFAFATSIAPIYPVYKRDAQGNIMKDSDGLTLYDYGSYAGMTRPTFTGANAIGDAAFNRDYSKGNALSASGAVEVKLPYGFRVTANQALDYTEYLSTSFTNPFYGMTALDNCSLYKTGYRRLNYTFQQLLNWSHDYGQNHVSALFGHENFFIRTYVLTASRKNMFDPTNMELAGMIKVNGANSYSTPYNNEGWLFRGQYDYDNRYFGSVSFRRDASSRFHPDHRWGSFWSIGGAWIINQESFLNDVTWIDMLKLKVSYGEQGNDNIGDWLYTNTYSVEASGDDVSILPYRKGNENITWEKNGNFNAGVEFAFLDNRLSGSAEFFLRKTSDMLFFFPLPPSVGWTGYYDNIGDMMNKGVEIDLAGSIVRTKDFNLDVNLNLTWYKNTISRLPEARRTQYLEGVGGFSSDSYFYGEGLPMYTFRMFRAAGVDPETGEQLWYRFTDEALAEASKAGISPEQIPATEENLTTTNNYSLAQYFNCGSALPKVYGGFGLTTNYKWFDLAVSFNYQLGGQCYDSGYAALMGSPNGSGGKGNNIHADILNAWTPENKYSNIPRYQYGDLNFTQTSSRFLISSNYLSLQTIVFGFTLPDNVSKKLFLKSCRIYFNADNVWLWSKRQGLDPRLSVAGGGNASYYSPIRTMSGGINVTF